MAQSQKQAISAGHATTQEAAKIILDNGGNAYDAAVAAAVTMFNAEPCMSSAGAGGFAMCLEAGKQVSMLDFFAHTPITKHIHDDLDFYPIEVDFGNEKEIFHVGLGSIATPGIIAGLFEMNRRYGSMPMRDILEVPLQYAKDGVAIDKFQSIDMRLLEPVLWQGEEMRPVFFNGDMLKEEGELLKMPRLPDFITMLQHEGEREFYHGQISKIVDDASREKGGIIKRQDFNSYQAIWRKPLTYKLSQYKLHAPSAPSLGGAIMLLFYDIIGKNGNNWIDAIAEIKANYASSRSLKQAMQSRFPDQAYSEIDNQVSTKGTSHFNILDKWGNAVSFTVSLGEGSGYFIPGTDMQLNNMLGEDFLLPDGFHSWVPDARLNSMMTPIIMTQEDLTFEFAAGSGGASRIPYMIAEALHYYAIGGMDLEQAINSPRTILQNEIIHAEAKFSQHLDNYPYDINIWDYQSLFFGGVHAISNHKKSGTSAIGDPRRYGSGIVF